MPKKRRWKCWKATAVSMPEVRWNTGATDSAWAGTFNCFSTLSPGADRIIRSCFSMEENGLGPRSEDVPRKSVTKQAERTPFGNIWETFQHAAPSQLLERKRNRAPAHRRSRLRT